MGFVVLESGQSHTIECRTGAQHDVACRLGGGCVPYLTLDLEPSQSILCDFDDARMVGSEISIRPWPSLSKSTRLMVNSASAGTARAVLSKGRNGAIGAFDLASAGRRMVCRASSFLAAGPGVMANSYTRHKTHAYGVLEFLVMDGSGWIFLQSEGEILHRHLLSGETADVNAAAIAAMSATVDLAAYPSQGRRQADREVDGRMARLTGPGNVWLQSCITPGDRTERRTAKQQTPQLALIS